MDYYVVNPARAGMIRHVTHSVDVDHGKPRASGDDPDLQSWDLLDAL